ncbi:PAS domain-containing sensor histidine kinase [Arthrobacter sp. TPD3018]|uniref:sensor histidine kinase n=1 Tax=Bacteria TaxID=2 RepID=UPI000D51392E|nr:MULTISPECIES: ATP-binding protein [Bacteria]PVE60077.1 PAS domain-containing sensor histidine kinase [Sphingomonas sp. TPD3009]PVE61591.1 PAS domain-containing sensor histidine kinase [Arthrobacter sp. TPD3018]PVE85490.1 PAS domain-containing sensor histidine kinase [Sphingomonas melonis]
MHAAPTPDLNDMLPVRRRRITPAVEGLVLALALAIAVATYFVLTGGASDTRVISPPLVALLLVANLVSGTTLMMLIGRRIARRRAVQSQIGGNGQLHVQLVALFSLVAAVPLVLVNIFASLLFQYGVEFWYSDRARGMLENSTALLQINYYQELDRIAAEASAMRVDLAGYFREYPINSETFAKALVFQLKQRNMSEMAIFVKGDPVPIAFVNPYERRLDRVVTPGMIRKIDSGTPSVVIQAKDRAALLMPLKYGKGAYLYVARVFDPGVVEQWKRGEKLVADYRDMQSRSRALQLRFNSALLGISLLIVALAVWIALAIADRLVRPLGELVGAARRVADGDLSTRVPDPRTLDEVGTLANAFNRMTGRLQEQNRALVTANDQLDNRRALIEAVMAGVSAGVIASGEDGTIRIANNSASELIGTGIDSVVGQPLALIAPELADLVASGQREAIVQVVRGGETRTLAVRIARTDAGPILTFDDITQQLLDQRRAAWSDVARRIAHEIKNPLTPIQLAAERLQRRYGSKIDPADTTFARLTETIVRQVGDLRRMVDEFSSFARMPKPVFREESLVDIARQALFLHEVAHPAIRFVLDHDFPAPQLVCDRHQLGRAFTNIVKNAVEAVESKGDGGGAVTMGIREDGTTIVVEVADTGVGLPPDRDRIVEPYMTTRARGTGLGLAIVKKIVEDHFGTMTFADRDGGGTVVRMTFDAAALAALDQGAAPPEPVTEHDGAGQLAALTRNRN